MHLADFLPFANSLLILVAIWYTKYVNHKSTDADTHTKEADTQKKGIEIELLVTEYWERTVKTLSATIDTLNREMESLKRLVDQNSIASRNMMDNQLHDAKLIKSLRKKNEQLQYSQSVLEIEVRYIKKHNNIFIKTYEIYLLDDDPDTIVEFEKKFNDVSIAKYVGYYDVDVFLAAVNKNQPPIVVIDYKLDMGKTAEDVIENLSYQPEIFIISVNEGFSERFINKRIKFFKKDLEDSYVTRISMEIINYLNEKI